jgi:hypothetical protein
MSEMNFKKKKKKMHTWTQIFYLAMNPGCVFLGRVEGEIENWVFGQEKIT